MKQTYQQELETLEATYRQSLHLDIGSLAELCAATAGQTTLFVASGGGLAAAQIAADQHTATHGELGVALSPLALVGEATVRRAAVVAISARAAHPDVGFALRAARLRHNYPVSLVTHRPIEDLDPALVRRLTSIVHVPSLARDGFLATNSVLSLATLFTRAADQTMQLPSTLPWLSRPAPAIRTRDCLVLYGPGQRAAAIDLETRLSEIGVAAVQVADYRNFAHGRHTGFARNIAHTTVVCLSSPRVEDLSRATTALLPADANVIELHSTLPEPLAALDLLVASMRVTGATATEAGIDPARPRVPSFGRRLYHLGAQRYLQLEEHGPVQRKLAALGVPASPELAARYSQAHARWTDAIAMQTFQSVVIDYDGTVCTTQDRFDLPGESVRQQLLRLLDGGQHLGFASGRGRSLHRDLRRWVPSEFWNQITLGLYNGATVLPDLHAEVPEGGKLSDSLRAFQERVRLEPLADSLKIEVRPGQVSVQPVTGTGIGVEATATWVSECIARSPRLEVKAFRSGHSVDIVDSSTSKVAVLDALEARCGAPALAIGDRGDLGGNDFELLASRAWTLSVDRCSGDQTRCWNLAPGGASGPDALVRYLSWLKPGRTGWRLRPSRSR